MRALIGRTLWRLGLREQVRADSHQHRKKLKSHRQTLESLLHDFRGFERSIGRTVERLQHKQQRLLERQDAFTQRLQAVLDGQRATIKALKELTAAHRAAVRKSEGTDRFSRRLHHARRFDYQRRDGFAQLLPRLDVVRLEPHIRTAMTCARMETDPFPYVLINEIFPRDFYELLIESLPPHGFWRSGRAGRENWTLHEDIGPMFTESVWTFTNDVLAVEVLTPAVIEKFKEPLARYCHAAFGPESAGEFSGSTWHRSGGRLMLRRPGYRIDPHLDPYRAMLTFLLYLARPGDGEEYGTKLFRTKGTPTDAHRGIFYADAEGVDYEFAKTIPYRPNSALVFLSPRALHGADIPHDATPVGLERYTYQFYVGIDKASGDGEEPTSGLRDQADDQGFSR